MCFPAGMAGMTSDTLFLGARIIGEGVDLLGDLLVRDGVIADFGQNLGKPDGATVIQADGATLCPGLVDMRAALGEGDRDGYHRVGGDRWIIGLFRQRSRSRIRELALCVGDRMAFRRANSISQLSSSLSGRLRSFELHVPRDIQRWVGIVDEFRKGVGVGRGGKAR